MTEGLFEKRLDEKKFIFNDVSLVGAILVENVHEIVGEAKKDFPDLAKMSPKGNTTYTVSWAHQAARWFEKWFGTAK